MYTKHVHMNITIVRIARPFRRLGAALAGDGALTPRLLGDASRAGRHDGQALKRVWHYVARFGSPEML